MDNKYMKKVGKECMTDDHFPQPLDQYSSFCSSHHSTLGCAQTQGKRVSEDWH